MAATASSSTTTKSVKVVKIHRMIYHVESHTKKGKFYSVIVLDGAPTSCNCGSFTYQEKVICKHMYDVMKALNGEIPVIDATSKPQKLTAKVLSYETDDYDF